MFLAAHAGRLRPPPLARVRRKVIRDWCRGSSSWRRRERRRVLHNAIVARELLALIRPPCISRDEFLAQRHCLRMVPISLAAAASSAPAAMSTESAGAFSGSSSLVQNKQFSDVAVQTESLQCDFVLRDQSLAAAPTAQMCCAEFFRVAQEVRRRLPHIVPPASALLMICDAPRPSAVGLPAVASSGKDSSCSPAAASASPSSSKFKEIPHQFIDLCANAEPSSCPRCGIMCFSFADDNGLGCTLCDEVSEFAMVCSSCRLVYCPTCVLDEVDDG